MLATSKDTPVRFTCIQPTKAGATRKTRAIFRAIYAAATGVAKVSGTQGKRVFSEPFDIARGVVQGDIISPILFILALDQLIKAHDVLGTGVKCDSGLVTRVLGYADDSALLEPNVDDMSARLTSLVDAAKREADMQSSVDAKNIYAACVQAERKRSNNGGRSGFCPK